MAEANLRTVLAAARGRGATAAPSNNEMEALLRILKTPASSESLPGDGETEGGPEGSAEPQEAASE
jgi:hypothetical protein